MILKKFMRYCSICIFSIIAVVLKNFSYSFIKDFLVRSFVGLDVSKNASSIANLGVGILFGFFLWQ